ncbi:MAG TPA: hypothetical protein VES01_06705 [Dermatophilaceae bacterium]|nr:hypothetical protein [Dermatophilaceae bacterium]
MIGDGHLPDAPPPPQQAGGPVGRRHPHQELRDTGGDVELSMSREVITVYSGLPDAGGTDPDGMG